jgi:hypothetical protein
VTAVRSPGPGPCASFRCHRTSLLVKSHRFDQIPFPFRLKLNAWSGRFLKIKTARPISRMSLEFPEWFDHEGEFSRFLHMMRRPETAHGGRFPVSYDGSLLSKAFHRLGLHPRTTSVVMLGKGLQHACTGATSRSVLWSDCLLPSVFLPLAVVLSWRNSECPRTPCARHPTRGLD